MGCMGRVLSRLSVTLVCRGLCEVHLRCRNRTVATYFFFAILSTLAFTFLMNGVWVLPGRGKVVGMGRTRVLRSGTEKEFGRLGRRESDMIHQRLARSCFSFLFSFYMLRNETRVVGYGQRGAS